MLETDWYFCAPGGMARLCGSIGPAPDPLCSDVRRRLRAWDIGAETSWPKLKQDGNNIGHEKIICGDVSVSRRFSRLLNDRRQAGGKITFQRPGSFRLGGDVWWRLVGRRRHARRAQGQGLEHESGAERLLAAHRKTIQRFHSRTR